MLPAVVAANLGMRSIVLAGDPAHPTVEAHLKKLKSKILANTALVQLDPAKQDSLGWLLRRNPRLKETMAAASGRPVVQACERNKCLDASDTTDIGRALDELGWD